MLRLRLPSGSPSGKGSLSGAVPGPHALTGVSQRRPVYGTFGLGALIPVGAEPQAQF